MDAEEPDEPLLLVDPMHVLVAFWVVTPHVPVGEMGKERMAIHRQCALDLLDWATCESDRGRELAEAKAQAGYKQRGGGTMFIGPFPGG